MISKTNIQAQMSTLLTVPEKIYIDAVNNDDWSPVVVVAKFGGTCIKCKKTYQIGERIECDPTFTPIGWSHTEC